VTPKFVPNKLSELQCVVHNMPNLQSLRLEPMFYESEDFSLLISSLARCCPRIPNLDLTITCVAKEDIFSGQETDVPAIIQLKGINSNPPTVDYYKILSKKICIF